MADLAIVDSPAYAVPVPDSDAALARAAAEAARRVRDRAQDRGIAVLDLDAGPAPFGNLALVHDLDYVEQVVLDGVCDEWVGRRPDLGLDALGIAGGTMAALLALLDGQALTGVHLMGGRTHAGRDRSGAGSAFNDVAVAAAAVSWLGRRTAVLDMSTAFSPALERLTEPDDRILTLLGKPASAFGGNATIDNPDLHAYRDALPDDATDHDLMKSVDFFCGLNDRFGADVMVIVGGPDGHADEPGSATAYTCDGLSEAARQVRCAFPSTPVLLLGGSGTLADDQAPRAWMSMAISLSWDVCDDERWFADLGDCPYELMPDDA